MRLILLLILTCCSFAEPRAKLNTESFFRFKPIKFGTTQLTIISTDLQETIINKITSVIKETDNLWSNNLGQLPRKNVTIVLLKKDRYLAETKAPIWSNAIFQDGKIYIPIDDFSNSKMKQLERTIKHEYTHAIISSLSNGNSPGWLDEGLAQLIEGDAPPELSITLEKWLKTKSPLSLSKLETGFTDFEDDKVAVAYAQSLYYTNKLVKSYGFKSIRYFLEELGEGRDSEIAFEIAFKKSKAAFEFDTKNKLKLWGLS